MPKIIQILPMILKDYCVKCLSRAIWSQSNENLCYWCQNNLKEQSHGNQPLQRSPLELSNNSKRASKPSNFSSRAIDNKPSKTDNESNVNSLKPYPIARKKLPKPR